MIKLMNMNNVKSSSTNTSIGQSIGIMLKGNSIIRKTVGSVGSKSKARMSPLPTYSRNSADVASVIQYEKVKTTERHRTAE